MAQRETRGGHTATMLTYRNEGGENSKVVKSDKRAPNPKNRDKEGD